MDGNTPALLRPELARLACNENAGCIVICTEIDRLGQDAQDILNSVARFRSCRIQLFCLEISDRINLASGNGESVLATISAYARLLTNVQGSRVRKGQAASKARGNELGRRVELSDADQQLILLMISQGQKVSAVAKKLGINRWAVNRAIERDRKSTPPYAPSDTPGLGVW